MKVGVLATMIFRALDRVPDRFLRRARARRGRRRGSGRARQLHALSRTRARWTATRIRTATATVRLRPQQAPAGATPPTWPSGRARSRRRPRPTSMRITTAAGGHHVYGPRHLEGSLQEFGTQFKSGLSCANPNVRRQLSQLAFVTSFRSDSLKLETQFLASLVELIERRQSCRGEREMRTLKTLAAFGALLLVATGANAAITFNVSTVGPTATPARRSTSPSRWRARRWIMSSVLSVRLAPEWRQRSRLTAVQSCRPVRPGGAAGPNTTCTNGTSEPVSCATSRPGATSCGLRREQQHRRRLVVVLCRHPVADGTYNLGRFTFTALAAGLVSIGNCEIRDATPLKIPAATVNNSVALNPIPEPTTAALLGLGLVRPRDWRRSGAARDS